jgi:dihydroneopterin aldolase
VQVLGDWIELESFRVDCILGVLDREQTMPQPLDIGLRLGLDLGPSGDLDALERTVNYASVVAQVAMLVEEGRFRLLESMAMAICRLLLAPPAPREGRAAVDRVEVSLRKPVVLGGRAVPGVRVHREAAWCDLRTRSVGPGVLVDVLHEAGRTEVYRLHLDGDATFDCPAHLAVMCMAGEVLAGEHRLSAGSRVLATGQTLRNDGSKTACLLAVGARGGLSR